MRFDAFCHPLRIAAALAVVAIMLAPRAGATDEGVREFDADDFRKHVRYLASDDLGGRLPGTPGGVQAAEYIADHFKRLGLKPAGDNGTYFQTFEVKRLKRFDPKQAKLSVTAGDQKLTLDVGKDWVPLPFSPVGDFTGPLVFAGYGIHAPEHDHDDYAQLDVKGKVVVVLRGEPQTPAGKSALDPNEDSTRHALFSRKAQVAADRGATALLIVNQRKQQTSDPRELLQPVKQNDSDELYDLQPYNTGPTYALPLAQLTRHAAERLLATRSVRISEPLLLGHLELALHRGVKVFGAAFDPKLTLTVKPGFSYATGRNVLAKLPGRDAPHEHILVGGHFDHLGTVPNPRFGDGKPVIHNGADDNASGTAAVLETARAFSEARRPPRRSILFAAWDAEELGLLGSAYFAEHPTVPLDQIKAVINFDMIGRLELDRFTIYGVGSAREFHSLLADRAAALDLDYRAPRSGRRTFGGSDHMTFHQRGLPVLFPFTGVHSNYNTPDDDWETIDADGATKILALFHPVILTLANLETGPTFVAPADERLPEREADEEYAAQQPGAAGAVEPTRRGYGAPGSEDDDTRPSRRRLKVALGVMPDMAAEPGEGMPIQAVMADGAAQAAGIQDGDVIRKIGDTNVTDIYSYMTALMAFEPGDEVVIVVTREGKPLKLTVTLKESTRSYQPQEQ